MATKKKKERDKFLKLIFDILFIDKCNGKETFAKHANKFAFIDPVLKENIERKSRRTKKIPVRVYQLKKDATFRQMVESLLFDKRKMPKLFLSEHQLLNFLLKYPCRLAKVGFTFLPFKLGTEFFVAHVHAHSDGSLSVHMDRLEYSSVWNAGFRPRLVVPQLA